LLKNIDNVFLTFMGFRVSSSSSSSGGGGSSSSSNNNNNNNSFIGSNIWFKGFGQIINV
jgi:hypothetical protein